MDGTTTMSWDDVHRLELQLRARSAAISGQAAGPHCCPACGREVDAGVQLGGVTVHQDCLPELREGR